MPDVNEPVYLTKARHAVDPTWAAGDFFLETPDAHGVFYRVFGPLAATLPLDQAAWIGRIAGWLALAIGFRHVSGPLVATSLGRIAAAALFAAGTAVHHHGRRMGDRRLRVEGLCVGVRARRTR